MSAVSSAPFTLPARPTEAEVLAKYFRAFGDPTRVRIMEELRKGELSVGEIVARVGVSQTGVSNHLGCLRWCGFVENRRDHRTIYYRLADERVAAILKLAQSLLADNAEHVAACRRIDGGG